MLWHRAKLIAAIYALVILISAIVSLVVRWEDIYG
jgi:capsular polysaccharide biosynthesis protein